MSGYKATGFPGIQRVQRGMHGGALGIDIVNPTHSEHCRPCKERVCELLTTLYGDCRVNHYFSWPAKPEAYEATSIGNSLRRICDALGALRGHREFVKSTTVPPCDYFIVDPGCILEFDESQHFSRPRLTALSLYPPEFEAGFSLTHWQELCRAIDAKDDDPVDRDERRAWYDTLRDLVPTLHGFRPTVRLYANDYAWCSLDSGSAKDQKTFASILKDRLSKR